MTCWPRLKHGAWKVCRILIHVNASARSWANLANRFHLLQSMPMSLLGTADVPGVNAPNSSGLAGQMENCLACARQAGVNPRISSFELVEINPVYDVDQRSARWAATMVWHFLMGLADRPLEEQPNSRQAEPKLSP